MRVAIVHYHLGPGGVARVIRTLAASLATAGVRTAVLTGDAEADAVAGASHATVPGLGYLADPGGLTAEDLANFLRRAAARALDGPPDVWHFHNHSLGKNVLLPGAVARLAAEGARLVLQLHDLAEHGRPENFQRIADEPRLYPVGPRVRYLFLNARDLGIFTTAGLPPESAVLVDNPVALAPVPPPEPGAPAILFAPVRGIRRKNLGELVLLARMAPPGTAVAVSRAPRDPAALVIHQAWEAFAGRHRIPIAFDAVDRYSPAAGAGADFDSWVAHASHVVTTSVDEGFGLPFLEAAAWSRPLVGRDLPHITARPAQRGIRCGRFYQAIRIPIDWIDRTVLRSELTTAMERHHRLYRRPLPPVAVEAALAAMITPQGVDFGNLPESLQQGAIERLCHPAERRVPLAETAGAMVPLEDWLAETLADRAPAAAPAGLASYAPERCRGALLDVFRGVMAAPAGTPGHLPPAAVLDAALAAAPFHFLLSAPPPATGRPRFRAVVFDVYGTLLQAPSGRVRPDPAFDPILRAILTDLGHTPPESPTTALHEAVLRHHAMADVPFPEVDLRVLWREILAPGSLADFAPVVELTEAAWHPARPMPGAAALVRDLARGGYSLGLLSNAQCNALPSLGSLADLFPPELILLSHRHGMAKPSPALFQLLADRLSGRDIAPREVLFVGDSEEQDIQPAAAAGFFTARFAPPGTRSAADFVFDDWAALGRWIRRPSSPPAKGFA